MSYIGNQPTSIAFQTDTFSGTGSTTAFTMSVAPANTTSVIVAITGVLQDPSTYSVSGTTLTFSAAPPSGTSNISVRYLGIPASGVTTTAYRTVTNFTATAGQTSFSTPSYTVGYINVFRNGVRLVSTDFTATTGTTVVLANACTVGDSVVTESFYVSSVLNAIPATAGSVSDSYIVDVSASKLTGSRTIPKGTMPAGSVLQVVSTNFASQGTTTSTSYAAISASTVTITPTSASSTILIFADLKVSAASQNGLFLTIYRNGTTALAQGSGAGGTTSAMAGWIPYAGSNFLVGALTGNFLDSPATTSSTTYTMYVRVGQPATLYWNYSNSAANADYGKFTSTLTALEIAG